MTSADSAEESSALPTPVYALGSDAELYPPGHTRRTIRAELVRRLRTKIAARGVASEQELDELDRAARIHLADPYTLVIPGVNFVAWGRKPV